MYSGVYGEEKAAQHIEEGASKGEVLDPNKFEWMKSKHCPLRNWDAATRFPPGKPWRRPDLVMLLRTWNNQVN